MEGGRERGGGRKRDRLLREKERERERVPICFLAHLVSYLRAVNDFSENKGEWIDIQSEREKRC